VCKKDTSLTERRWGSPTYLLKSYWIFSRDKLVRGENTKMNYGMDTTGEKEKRTPKEKRGWKEYKQP
jgi:hypothetical protein